LQLTTTLGPLIEAKKKKRLQWAPDHKYWTIKEWKNIAWSNESKFLLRHANGSQDLA
jgi:hypothetical protein